MLTDGKSPAGTAPTGRRFVIIGDEHFSEVSLCDVPVTMSRVLNNF